jgi:hypothetical protein
MPESKLVSSYDKEGRKKLVNEIEVLWKREIEHGTGPSKARTKIAKIYGVTPQNIYYILKSDEAKKRNLILKQERRDRDSLMIKVEAFHAPSRATKTHSNRGNIKDPETGCLPTATMKNCRNLTDEERNTVLSRKLSKFKTIHNGSGKTGNMKYNFKQKDILKREGGWGNMKCYLTGRKINDRDSKAYALDHKSARAKGGTNDFDNCGVVCTEANVAKGDGTIEELIELSADILRHHGYKVVGPELNDPFGDL